MRISLLACFLLVLAGCSTVKGVYGRVSGSDLMAQAGVIVGDEYVPVTLPYFAKKGTATVQFPRLPVLVLDVEPFGDVYTTDPAKATSDLKSGRVLLRRRIGAEEIRSMPCEALVQAPKAVQLVSAQ